VCADERFQPPGGADRRECSGQRRPEQQIELLLNNLPALADPRVPYLDCQM
jgi:hypothetical protein